MAARAFTTEWNRAGGDPPDSPDEVNWLGEARLLLRLDQRRAAAVLRRPEAGVWIGVLLPLAVVVGVAWSAGAAAVPDVREAAGAVVLGVLVAAPVSFLAYGVLFRPRDDAFLRRLGLAARALYTVRAARLLAAALALAALVLLPFLSAGVPLARPAVLALGVALAAWAASLWTTAAAAAAVARDPSGHSHRLLSMGMWDRELARAAPLVWAPVPPLLAGAFVGGFLGAVAGVPWARLPIVAALALGIATLAGTPFERALAHFAPRALEMAFAPPPAAGETGLVLGRGLARLLPERVAAVRARDAAVAARRYRWAATIVWPVVFAAAVALARWGGQTQVRSWVIAAGTAALLLQGAALVGLGRLERAGPRWLDRALGLGAAVRWAGRAAHGFGVSLWLVVPLALLWAGFTPVGSAWWAWPAAAVAVAALASAASVAAAGR